MQLIATYVFTILLLWCSPRLLFVLMCFCAGYPFFGVVALLIMMFLFIVRHG
jgi:hypothetical protein